MTRKSKALIAVVVMLVAANVIVFSYFLLGGKKGDDLDTTIVKDDEQVDEKRKASEDLDLIFGKIKKVEDGVVEYIELMNGLVENSKENRKEVKIKITEKTEIEVPCLYLYEKQISEEEALSGEEPSGSSHEEEGTSGGNIGEIDSEEGCEGQVEDLKAGDFILVSGSGDSKIIRKKL